MQQTQERGASAPLLLRVTEAAVALAISRSAAYQLVKDQRLPAVHVGRSLRIRRSDVEAFVNELSA